MYFILEKVFPANIYLFKLVLKTIEKGVKYGVMVITTAPLHSTKLRSCTGSNSARSVSEIHDGEDL